jgi:outer membrane protein TolC
VNLSFAQNLYTGGRIGAQRDLATSGRQAADLSLASARAQLALDVTQAYYDAALSDQFVAISEAALRQAEATLAQVEQARAAGRVPEFDQLRARVARDNERPVVIRARASRTLAYLRLKQLLEVPPEQDLTLSAGLDQADLPPPERYSTALASFEASQGVLALDRSAVRQATVGVAAREASFRLARAQRLPSVNFNSSYGRVAYPSGMPSFSDFRTNWTLGVQAQVPLFTGGRQRGDEMVARADVAEAQAQLALTRQLADVDTRGAYEQLTSARAAWDASAGTVEQANRAYEIAELRYREGISTQVELSDARLLLEQAQANRAQAARDLQVARAHAALLPDLPLGPGGGGATASTTAAGSAQSPGQGGAPSQSFPFTGQQGIGTGQTGATAGAARSGGAGNQ